MNATSNIDVQGSKLARDGDLNDLVLGEDWVQPESEVSADVRARRKRSGLIAINRSPLARKIITFNLLAMLILVAGVLYLNPVRDNLVHQRETALVTETHLIADVFEAQLAGSGTLDDAAEILRGLRLAPGTEIYVFDTAGALLASTVGQDRARPSGLPERDETGSTFLTDSLHNGWSALSRLVNGDGATANDVNVEEALRSMVADAVTGETEVKSDVFDQGGTIFSVAAPIVQAEATVGIIGLSSAAGEIDHLVRSEREQVLQMFVIAILVSIGLSLVLASTIANPLSDLAAAAEIGRDKNSRNRSRSPARVRIPDLSGRPDEIGRLSGALRGMVGALYERIDANEQFAADVAHEIKNPLASLRSAIGTLRVAKRDDQRERLLEVIEHDVRRLDRLVSDISNASRLDSELVKEDEELFDLLKMLRNLTDYLGNEAREKGIEFITDMPTDKIEIHGLEARLAQVFVNLISNAISFCDEGDAIRVWVRRREDRVLVVVEDTGPGIPEEALTKIFNRFYSERPAGQFGNNSGLGLAISKQIVEAHSGVIWSENIRPTDADLTSDPLGARFVVGLPI